MTARPPALIANLICRRLFFFSFLTPALAPALKNLCPAQSICRGCVLFEASLFSSRGISLFDCAGFVSCEICCVAKAAGGLLRSRLSTLRFSLTNSPRNSLAASRFTELTTLPPPTTRQCFFFTLILGLFIVCAVEIVFWVWVLGKWKVAGRVVGVEVEALVARLRLTPGCRLAV